MRTVVKSYVFEENQRINFNVVTAAIQTKVSHFIAAGTGCAYPKRLEGKCYARVISWRAPLSQQMMLNMQSVQCYILCRQKNVGMNYSYFLPANIYGPHDNFHPTDSMFCLV